MPEVTKVPGFTRTVNSVSERNVEICGAPLKVTLELGAKPEPSIASVKVGDCDGTLAGFSAEIDGTGKLTYSPQEANSNIPTISAPAESLERKLKSVFFPQHPLG